MNIAITRKYNKYRVSDPKDRTTDGIVFDSKKEMVRYLNLKLLERAGEIKNLELQKKFDVNINGHKVFTYHADFTYSEGGQLVIEDVKGVKTPLYRLKAKCIFAAYGIKIRET